MTDAVIVFPPGWRATDASDLPISGAKIKFFATGSTTPKTVYSDQLLATALGTEVTCDSGGYPVSGGSTKTLIYTDTDSYKVRLTTSADVLVWEHDALKGAVAAAVAVTKAIPLTPMVTRTTTYTTLTTDQGKWLNANPTTSGSFAITLLSAVTAGDGFAVGIRHVGTANVVTVRTTGSETLLFSGQTKTAFTLTGKGHGVWIVSDGGNWHVTTEAPALMPGNGLPMFLCTDRLAAPPTSPVGGQRYIINATPTGAWSTLGFVEKDVVESDGNGSWFAYTPAEGWLAYVEDENLYTAYVGSAWADQVGMSAAQSSVLQHATFSHTLASGTAGGAATGSAWTTRTLNTTDVNTITNASLSADAITLPAGTYFVIFHDAHQNSNQVRTRLKSTTTSTAIYSTSAYAAITDETGLSPVGSGILTLSASEAFKLEYYRLQAADANDLGIPISIASISEVHAKVSIQLLTALQGPAGAQGTQGTDGLDAAHPYQWSTSTSGDPGSGNVLGNSATIASITQISISETDSAGGSNAAVIDTWDDSSSTTAKGTLKLTKEGAPQNFHVFRITGAQTDAGTYRTFPVTYIATSGTIANGNNLAVLFIEKGDIGDPGITVPTVSSLTTMTTGQIDRAADFLIIRDTSAGSDKKITPDIALEPLGLSLGSGNRESVLSLNGTQTWCLPNQTTYPGTQWIGSGGSAALSHTTLLEAYYNLGIGLRCLTKLTTGSYNVGGGFEVMEQMTTGSWNTAFGEAALTYATSAFGNAAFGWKAMLGTNLVVSGAVNNGSGLVRLTFNVAVSGRVDTGLQTGDIIVVASVGGVTAANGTWTVTRISTTQADLQGSTFSGVYTSGGTSYTTVRGSYNSAVGYSSLNSLTSGVENTVLGASAGRFIANGNYNTIVGSNAALALISGIRNVALGSSSLPACIAGDDNMSIGYSSLFSCLGSQNIGIGFAAGYSITTGSGNTAIGFQCQTGITTGVYNTVIGAGTYGLGVTTGSYNTVVGGGVTGLSAALSNNVILADGQGVIRLQTDSNGDHSVMSVLDNAFLLRDNGDRTKVAAFEASGITTATTRTYTLPNASGTLPLLGLAQTWSAIQTFSVAPTVSSATIGRNTLANLGGWTVLAASAVAASVTGTTVETTLATISVPANSMGPNGIVRVTVQYSFSGAVGTKTERIKFGGTNYSGLAYTTAALSARTQAQLANRNATNSQVGNHPDQVNWTQINSAGGSTTSAVDTTSNQNILITMQLSSALDTATLEAYTVELYYGA